MKRYFTVAKNEAQAVKLACAGVRWNSLEELQKAYNYAKFTLKVKDVKHWQIIVASENWASLQALVL